MSRGRQKKLMDNWLCSYCVSSVSVFPFSSLVWFKVDFFCSFLKFIYIPGARKILSVSDKNSTF